MNSSERIRQAAILIERCRRLVVLTGAGVSRESGVPTFREKGEGLWSQYDPMQVASITGFLADPVASWRWHEHLRDLCRQAQPNPGHVALAQLERLLPQVVLVTQNIDDLHQRAGSTDVVPIHGTLMRNRCFFDCLGDPTYLTEEEMEPGFPDDGVPRCLFCGRWARPDVVWFGEMLPPELIDRAVGECRQADVLLVVGTSGIVQPAASLPYLAKEFGAHLIDVNPNRSGITAIADVWLEGPSGEILPQVVEAVRLLREEKISSHAE